MRPLIWSNGFPSSGSRCVHDEYRAGVAEVLDGVVAHILKDLIGFPLKGVSKLRYVVEQTFALLHHFKRLAVHWERRTELHDALVSPACGLICRRRLEKTRS
ncbi:hypothetical protein OHU45_38030 [Streptomyces tubercidicus]|uniref:hypothetical protein n=1 Tax=Streptomyces tubercidicus TaxID=47759 RepID=UPI003757B750